MALTSHVGALLAGSHADGLAVEAVLSGVMESYDRLGRDQQTDARVLAGLFAREGVRYVAGALRVRGLSAVPIGEVLGCLARESYLPQLAALDFVVAPALFAIAAATLSEFGFAVRGETWGSSDFVAPGLPYAVSLHRATPPEIFGGLSVEALLDGAREECPCGFTVLLPSAPAAIAYLVAKGLALRVGSQHPLLLDLRAVMGLMRVDSEACSGYLSEVGLAPAARYVLPLLVGHGDARAADILRHLPTAHVEDALASAARWAAPRSARGGVYGVPFHLLAPSNRSLWGLVRARSLGRT